MGERAEALAQRFEQLNNDLISKVEGCSDAQWATKCADTGWSVAVQAHHTAVNEAGLAGMVGMLANGQDVPRLDMDAIHAGNAKHAEEYANVSREETAKLLRENGAKAVQTIRSLSDEQLDRTSDIAGGRVSTVEQLIHFLNIGELERHGEHLQQAVAS